MKVTDWSKYPNFTREEFDCKETGENEMQDFFMEKIQAIRTEYCQPMKVNSGYRSPLHSLEAKKSKPGEHCHGCAVDIACSSKEALAIIAIALKLGITRVGVSQRNGVGRYVHLGMGDISKSFPPAIWSY